MPSQSDTRVPGISPSEPGGPDSRPGARSLQADKDRLAALREEFEGDARFGQVFVVLTLGSSLIASLGLLGNSAAVVIGAMVVAPWILPLQAMAFQVLRGQFPAFLRALLTLALGVGLGLAVSVSVGLLVQFPVYGSEVMARTRPNLLDLGIALAAGVVAMFAKLRKEAITAMAGLAIAVALVPPVCVAGLLLSAGRWQESYGAALLFLTNLLGILTGAMVTLNLLERPFRGRLLRSRLGLTSLALTAMLVIPLGGSLLNLMGVSRRQVQAQRIEDLILSSLRNETITLGRDSELESVRVDWEQNPPVVTARVSVSDPRLPTFTQVSAVQEFINTKLAPRRFRLVVKRTSIDVVGPEPQQTPGALVDPLWPWLSPPVLPLGEGPDGSGEPRQETGDAQNGEAKNSEAKNAEADGAPPAD
ncbi:DUF389 domain-containing protein [Cyanobium sp. CH-040]|uniref:DUF389 domain-containing protein n=1 Tax=Cyanobium sp. CH-040 TaxID=2823708 RepID=UPI0020CE4C15|nr:DUF389 domain-containing protein [Cyanobium sp. CH-040]MCP9929088.1 DUF389 domain-containing protein [Cyanobium sp. CH-040]